MSAALCLQPGALRQEERLEQYSMSLAEANWRWVRGIDVPFDELRQHILCGTRLSGHRGYSLHDEQDHSEASSGGAAVRGAERGGRERDGWRVVQLTDIHLHPDPDHTHPTIGMYVACVAPTQPATPSDRAG